MTIIKIEAVNGLHSSESQSHRTSNWMGDGWLEVPSHLLPVLTQCRGYCQLQVTDGALVGLIPTEIPPEPPPESTQLDELALLVVDHEVQLAMLELGVM